MILSSLSLSRYLAAGALSVSDAEKATVLIRELLVNKEGMVAFETGAAKKRLDTAWAVQALKDLLRVLIRGVEMSPKPALLIGVFE